MEKKKIRYLSYPLKRISCNFLIQPRYDFTCCSWYPNLSMSLKTELQTTLKDNDHRINEFEKVNWLPVSYIGSTSV